MSSKSVSQIFKILFQTGIGRSWSSAKLFIVQNYTENANGDAPLTAENV